MPGNVGLSFKSRGDGSKERNKKRLIGAALKTNKNCQAFWLMRILINSIILETETRGWILESLDYTLLHMDVWL